MADGSDIVEQSREIIRDGDRCGSAAKHPTTILTRHLMEKLCDEVDRLRAQAPGWRADSDELRRIAFGLRIDGRANTANTIEGIADRLFPLPSPPAEGGKCSPFGLGGPADKPTDA